MPTALVTGASRGLGLEFTRQLLDRDWQVWGTARHPDDSAGLTALEDDRLCMAPLDVSSLASIEALANEIGGPIDLLVNNAGINSSGVAEGHGNVRFGALEPEGIERMIRVNAIGPLLLLQALAPRLEEAGGKVLNISSWLGSIAGKTSGGNYGYCASKATLNMLMRAAAFDLKPRGVTVVLANPGWVQTDMGGEKANRTPAEAVSALLDAMAGLTLEDTGRFVDIDGADHPW